MSTLLTELVRKQVSLGLIGMFSKTVDKVVEDMVFDLLREPDFRNTLRTLIRTALDQALKDLNEPAPPPGPTMREEEFDRRLNRIEQRVRDLREKPQ